MFNSPVLMPVWRDLALDVSMKNALLLISEFTWKQKWLQQNRIKWWVTKSKARKVHWKITAKTLHPSRITSFISNFKESKFRQFSLKLLNDELPTMNNLHKRKPWIYQSDTCPFCNIEKEDNIHIFTCQAYTNINTFEELKEKFIMITHAEVNKFKPRLKLKTTRGKLQ